MISTLSTPSETSRQREQTNTNRQIRGSSLLLAGRFLSKGLNFLVQLLIVRTLSETDFGTFAYALAVVQICQHVATLGLDRAITRFVPIYHEHRDYRRLFGTIVMCFTTIFSIGLIIALLFVSFRALIADTAVSNPTVLRLLLLLIFLTPLQAIDDLLVGMFAVFASPRAIFFRKHVLAPCLKLLVVLGLIIGQSGLMFLARGYLAASFVGVAIYSVMLFRMLRRDGLLAHFHLSGITIPWRDILTFSIPLLTSDLVYAVMNGLSPVMIEYYWGVSEVASLRAVLPAAMLNQLVMASFATLFTPSAARLFARNDRIAINNLYWHTAVWIALLTFPIFALTFSLSHSITVLLYGNRYAHAAMILSLLSLGHYVNAATGHNGLTLKVYGKVRYVVSLNIATAVISLLLNVLLIPKFGAHGAALAICCTLIIHNIFKQVGLRLGTGINLFEVHYGRVYLSIALATLVLGASQWVLTLIHHARPLTVPPGYISIVLAALVTALIFRLNRHLLDVEHTFPEVLRIPLARWLLCK